MSGRTILLSAALALAAALVPASAQARPIDKGQFHDVSSDTFDCDGTPARYAADVTGHYVFNLRGSSPFPYYRESFRGSVVYTNLDTGRTLTSVFSTASQDHRIVDNGDGTITITEAAAGNSRLYDETSRLVLRDPGRVVTAYDVDYHGTPSDPSDDVEVPGSFRIVKPSTGHSDSSGLDFCTVLREHTG